MGETYDLLKEGLTEALEHAKGERTLRTKEIRLPDPPKKYHAKDIKRLRRKLRCSQHIFAIFLNVSPKTVQAWESGERHPNSITNRFLEIVESENKRERFFSVVTTEAPADHTLRRV